MRTFHRQGNHTTGKEEGSRQAAQLQTHPTHPTRWRREPSVLPRPLPMWSQTLVTLEVAAQSCWERISVVRLRETDCSSLAKPGSQLSARGTVTDLPGLATLQKTNAG